MSASAPPSIAIVGRGFSGVAAATALIERMKTPFALTMVDPSESMGEGLAYGMAEAGELLNVRARDLSISASRPGEFAAWLAPRLRRESGAVFAPRRLFGAYARESFLKARLLRRDVRTEMVKALVERIALDADGRYQLHCSGGALVRADAVILATGFGAARGARFGRATLGGSFSPPQGDDRRVILVGGGLTAVDVILRLRRKSFCGPILVISRRGLAPLSHAEDRQEHEFWAEPEDESVASALMAMRMAAARCAQEGDPWQSVLNGARRRAQQLWSALPEAERRRFNRHARAYWNVHRHRLAPFAHAAIAKEIRSGRTTLRKGTALGVAGEGQLDVLWRGKARAERLEADLIVDCSGHYPDYSTPLYQSLLAEGLVSQDVCGRGIVVGPDGAVAPARRGARLFAIGPVGEPSLLEITAVPEIIRQCALAADTLSRQSEFSVG